ncbi:hypothetical protein BC834DRAFT_420160 [Gloeopeniophorella convolvens]|nr:hypothetical protein BC834DRAFT_420160 [Gloeopeniophorella convolvens]
MTEYDYSPEAYERYMATQTRISNWIDTVSQSTHTPSPSSRHSHSSDYHHRSRSRTSHSQPQSQSHSRSNSLSRTHSRGHHPQQRDYSRPRSYSQSGSRPQASRSHTSPHLSTRAHILMRSTKFNHPLPCRRHSRFHILSKCRVVPARCPRKCRTSYITRTMRRVEALRTSSYHPRLAAVPSKCKYACSLP